MESQRKNQKRTSERINKSRTSGEEDHEGWAVKFPDKSFTKVQRY